MPEETQEQQQTDAEATGDDVQDDLPANAVAVEDVGTLKKKVTITVPRERIDAKLDEMFGELHHSAQVPGFRPGRAPRRLIEKRFAKEVGQDVRNALIGESIGDAIEKSDLQTLGEPDVDLDEIELPASGEMAFSFQVEVMPTFELPELKGIKVQKPPFEVTDERIGEYVQQLAQGRATFAESEGPAGEGDIVTADATIIGEDIDDHKTRDLQLRVAPGQVEGLPLVDLGNQLAGKKVGQSATIKTTVPEAHPNQQWRGKEVSIEITISQLRKRILPEVNDEFAEATGFDSVAQLRKFVGERLESQADAQIRRDMRDQIVKYLLANTEFDLPDAFVARHTERVLQRRYVDLLYQGVSQERIEENLTQLQAEASQQAMRGLRSSFILREIADRQEINADDDEVNARIAEMAQQSKRRPQRVREELQRDGTISQVEISIREEKALDKLLEQAEIVDAPPVEAGEESEKKAKKTKKAKKAKKTAASKADSDEKKPAKPTAAGKARKSTGKKAPKKDTKKE